MSTATQTTETHEKLKANNLKPLIGSEVHLSKDELLSGQHANDLRDLLEQRGVLVFPKIDLNGDEQVAFTETLGTPALEIGGETLYKITLDASANAKADYLKGSMFWHIDGTMNAVPILASILSGKVLSETGGNTEFCSTYAAWDHLPEEDKKELEKLRVVHSAWATLFYYSPEPDLEMLQQMQAIGDRELPLVWKHQNDRKSLVIGATAYEVLGKSTRESKELLVRLREWATQPDFVYSHKWSKGDMVIWDNTGTMHRATPYDPTSGRMMLRTKLEGEEPFE